MTTNEKRIPKARWFYIIPICFLTNFFCFMDRQVISIALPGGVQSDLAMNSTMAGLAAGVVSIGMLFLTVPAGELAQKGKIKKLIAFCIGGWSIFSILSGLVTAGWQLIIIRFLLGLCEGAIGPGVTTLITYWFPDKDGERNRANSAYFTSVTTAAILMGPIAGFLIQNYSWRFMFIIIGAASFVTLILWIAFIHDRPEQAKWLSEEERNFINNTIKEEREMVKEVTGDVQVESGKSNMSRILHNKYVWSLCIIGFTVNIGQFGFAMWMPTMIKTLTNANILSVGLISVIPNVFVLIGMWTWSYLTAHSKSRRAMTGTPLMMFAIALLIANLATGLVSPIIGIILLCLVSFFIQGHMPSYYTIPSLVMVKELDGSTRGLMAFAMGAGSFVGPYAVGYLTTMTGSTKAGFYFLIGMLVIGSLSSLILPKNLGVNKVESTDK